VTDENPRAVNEFAVGSEIAGYVHDERGSLAVVSVQRALRGQGHALLSLTPNGRTPRNLASVYGGSILMVTENGSGQLQAIYLPSTSTGS
jgi:hypothetical protein